MAFQREGVDQEEGIIQYRARCALISSVFREAFDKSCRQTHNTPG